MHTHQEKCCNPEKVADCCLQRSRPIEDVNSTWSLILLLEDDGWTWAHLPQKPMGEMAAYIIGGPKVWRTRTSLPYKDYLRCLLQCDRLIEHGIQAVPHGRDARFYADLLKGEERQDARAALDDDVARMPPRALVVARPGSGDERQPDSEGEELDFDLVAELERVLDGATPVGSGGGDGGATPVALLAAPALLQAEPPPLPPPVDAPPVRPQQSSQQHAVPAPAISLEDLADIRKTTYWGCFRLTPKAATRTRPFGHWEAACPFHKLNDVTGCKRTLPVIAEGEAGQVDTMWKLRHWCNLARDFRRQRWHVRADVDVHIPPREIIRAQKIPESARPARGSVVDDVTMGPEGSAAPILPAASSVGSEGVGPAVAAAAGSSSSDGSSSSSSSGTSSD